MRTKVKASSTVNPKFEAGGNVSVGVCTQYKTKYRWLRGVPRRKSLLPVSCESGVPLSQSSTMPRLAGAARTQISASAVMSCRQSLSLGGSATSPLYPVMLCAPPTLVGLAAARRLALRWVPVCPPRGRPSSQRTILQQGARRKIQQALRACVAHTQRSRTH
jgi:hypothetical protein